MPVNYHGKDYKTVAERLGVFFKEYQGHYINTSVVHQDADRVTIRAEIVHEGKVIATGHACNERGSDSFTGKDTEKCETTAVGRALAFLSEELMGSDIASADEIEASNREKLQKELWARFAATTAANEEHHSSLIAIREFLAEDNFDAAREAWNEVDDESKIAIWVATTKGGWFTPRERNQMKWWSNDFEKSRK